MNGTTLRRSIGLPLLSLYGLGTILGAGIYVLIGEVAGVAGTAAPLSFVVASVLAGTTAFSFAELGSRVPRSAGEAAYVHSAFGIPALTAATGWAVVIVGFISAATMVRGFVGYLGIFVELPDTLVIPASVAVLTAIAAWGIGESLGVAAAVTLLEIGGLLFVSIAAGDAFARLPTEWQLLLPSLTADAGLGILSGAFVAFYAFIGFEDMVNVAEEVQTAEKTLPRAILIALFVSTGLYFLVAVVSVLAVPLDDLANHPAPLAMIIESRGLPPETIAAISLFAVMNGALVQIIMASRVLYGLAEQRLAWHRFARINSRTRTPLVATCTVAMVLAILAMLFPLGALARATSFVALAIFLAVNLALIRIKSRGEAAAFVVPMFVPIAGAIMCVAMLVYEGLT